MSDLNVNKITFISFFLLSYLLLRTHKTMTKKNTRKMTRETEKWQKQFLVFLVEFIAIFPKLWIFPSKIRIVDYYSTPDEIFKIFYVNFIIISHCELKINFFFRRKQMKEHFKNIFAGKINWIVYLSTLSVEWRIFLFFALLKICAFPSHNIIALHYICSN